MKTGKLSGLIERRVVVFYRLDPQVAAQHVPVPFKPLLVDGSAVGCVNLMRICDLRPHYAPSALGVDSENAEHRIAVTWAEDGVHKEGYFAPLRHTNSRLKMIAGHWLSPGHLEYAKFKVSEADDYLHMKLKNGDGSQQVGLSGQILDDDFPFDSVFRTMSEAVAFAQRMTTAYCLDEDEGCFDGVTMVTEQTEQMACRHLSLEHMSSSYFSNNSMFPGDSAKLDAALVHYQLDAVWEPCLRLPAATMQTA